MVPERCRYRGQQQHKGPYDVNRFRHAIWCVSNSCGLKMSYQTHFIPLSGSHHVAVLVSGHFKRGWAKTKEGVRCNEASLVCGDSACGIVMRRLLGRRRNLARRCAGSISRAGTPRDGACPSGLSCNRSNRSKRRLAHELPRDPRVERRSVSQWGKLAAWLWLRGCREPGPRDAFDFLSTRLAYETHDSGGDPPTGH